MLKNPTIKKILQALAVAVFGYILLNLAFIFDFLFQSAVIRIINLFVSADQSMSWYWFAPLMHILFMIIIGLTSWMVFKSKLGAFYKAIYTTVPTAVILVTVGISLYRWPVAAYLSGGLICLGGLYYFYRTKQPWLYYYSVILVGLALAIFSFLGGEI